MRYLILIVLVSGCLQTEYNPNIVTKIIDGDTLELSSGETVRLLCVNTPEIGENGYQEAKDFTSNLLGKEIRMEKKSDNRDRFGRLLRIVYFTENESEHNLNKMLLDKNLAVPLIFNEEDCESLEIEP